MATFALVHGAWHGGWCWERLVPELERRGHRAVAPDLPCEDPGATFSDYAGLVVDALAGADGDVVVVGHSVGGHTIPLVAAQRPVRRLAYVCGLLSRPGRSMIDELRAGNPPPLRSEYEAGLGERDEEGRRRWADFELAWSEMYADCDEATARAAFDRLRPQASEAYRVPCPLDSHPAVESTYVLCTDDRIVDPEWSRPAARELLGVEAGELPGSHSPFVSRPAALADLLVRGL